MCSQLNAHRVQFQHFDDNEIENRNEDLSDNWTEEGHLSAVSYKSYYHFSSVQRKAFAL